MERFFFGSGEKKRGIAAENRKNVAFCVGFILFILTYVENVL